MRRTRSRYSAFLLALLLTSAALFLLSCFLGFSTDIAPLRFALTLDSPAQAVFAGGTGGTGGGADSGADNADSAIYVLDAASTRVTRVRGGELVWRLTADSDSDTRFSKAQTIASDEAGALYVHDVAYDAGGVLILRERVLRYTPDGALDRALFTLDYDGLDASARPANVGNILCMEASRGVVRLLIRAENALKAVEIDLSAPHDAPPAERAFSANSIGGRLLAATFAPDGGVVFTAKAGGVWRLDESGETPLYLPDPITSDRMSVIACNLDCAEDGTVYFSDIGLRRVLALAPDAAMPRVVVDNLGNGADALNDTPLRYAVCVGENGDLLTVSERVERWLDSGTASPPAAPATLTAELHEIALPTLWACAQTVGWASLALLVAAFLLGALLLITRLFRASRGLSTRLSALSLLIVLVTASLVGGVTMMDSGTNIDKEFNRNISYLTLMAAGDFGGDDLRAITTSADIASESYARLHARMDTYIDTAYSVDYGLYCMLYKDVAGVTCVVMDSEGQYPAIYPQYIDPELNRLIYEERAYAVQTNYRDAHGVWAFCVAPVLDGAGGVAGVIEMGVNMLSVSDARSHQTVEMTLTVAVIALLVLFLLGEGIAFTEARRLQRMPGGEGGERVLRLVMFLLMAAQSMQDSFIPVLSAKLYTGIAGLPDAVGATLPMTLEMALFAVVASMGGHLLARVKLHRALRGGLAVAAAGFAVSMLAGDFGTLLVGKALIGMGVGFSYITLNAMAAAQETEERSDALFSQINAGMLAGTQTGIIVGAYLYAALSYRGAYAASVAFSLLAGFVALRCVTQSMNGRPACQRAARIGAFAFLRQRRVWSFLLFALVPMLVATGFFDYYFPIFGAANGLSEQRVGQVMLLNGVFSIYLGPTLTRVLLRRLGARRATAFAALLFALALGLFAAKPGIVSMIALACVFGIVTGFSYSVQDACYNRLEGVAAYGPSRAMGLFAMFQGIAQTFAPMLIATLLLSGESRGAGGVAILVGAGALLFLFLSAGGGRKSTHAPQSDRKERPYEP